MKPRKIGPGLLCTSAFLALAVAPLAPAQTVAPASPASSAEDETIELSPFVIVASEDAGYSARSSLAGTRIRTELKDVGSSISVITPKFLQDTNSKNSADLLVYATNSEVAGQSGNYVGGGDGSVIDSTGYTRPVANTRVRGLAEADNLRDFFLTDIPWDSYNVGRVDLQRGPNSVLFGIGSPAGVINSSLNQASLKDSNLVETQVGSYGSTRVSADFNKVILKDELALRIAALSDNTKYRQKPAHRDDERIYGALRYEPKFLSKNGAKTSFRANFEQGNVDANYPRLTPPIDAITPYFSDPILKGRVFDTRQADSSDPILVAQNPGAGLANNATVNYSPWVGVAGGRIFDGAIAMFGDPNSSAQNMLTPAGAINWPTQSDTSRNYPNNGSFRGIVNYDTWARRMNLPGAAIGAYKARSLTDPSVFDFYNNLMEGPNKKNWNKFKTYNVALSQTFFNNKLGFELVQDYQDARWGHRNVLDAAAGAISIDINSTLVDGSPNPNAGKAMLVGSGGSAGAGRTRNIREATRFTSFGELDFNDILNRQSLAAKILGRQLLTYSLSSQGTKTNSEGWVNSYIDSSYGPASTSAVGQATRDLHTISYLTTSSIANRGSASGLNLQRVNAEQVPSSGSVMQWNTTNAKFQPYDLKVVTPGSDIYNDEDRPYLSASKTKEVISSNIFVWQGYFLGGNLVPMVGWRKDVDKAFDAGTPNKTQGIVSNILDPEWRLPSGMEENNVKGRSYARVEGQTRTWSIVAHVPKSLMKYLPGDLDFRIFYNRSENFRPDAARIDIVGNHVPSPTGKTKDYGFAISAFDQRVTLKVNRYETSIANATISGALNTAYRIGAGEAWGQTAAYALKNNTDNWTASGNYGTTSSGKILKWEPRDIAANHEKNPDGSYQYTASGAPIYTQAAIDAQQATLEASVADWFAHPVSAEFQKAWGLSDYATGGGSWSMNSVAVTGDTLSKGTEFELVANPIKGLDISFNASKTDAKRLNLGQAYTDWINTRLKDYEGPMGQMRMWGGANWAAKVSDAGVVDPDGGTVYGSFRNDLIGDYKLMQSLNGATVAELRPWRFNVTANYGFQSILKGAKVGGSYRWMDKQVTGFKVTPDGKGYDVNNRWYGPSQDAVDIWVGYEKMITSKIKWRTQLNIRDIFASNKLIPLTVQPDGTPAAYRIPEPRVITLTNSFEF